MPLTFEEYLPRLLDPAARLAAGELRVLSGLTPGQLRAIGLVWPRLSPQRRRQLVHLMAELAEDNPELDFNDVYLLGLGDKDEEVRRLSVEGLWEDERLTTADALVRALRSDPSPLVRAGAATSLGHFVQRIELQDLEPHTGEQLKQALYEAIEDQAEPLEVRRRAVESVAYLSEERARAAIADAYASEEETMRASAVCGMGRSCDRRWLPAVLKELQARNAELRFEAARASGALEDQRAVPLLLRLLVDSDREVRFAALDALGKVGGAEARKALHAVIEAGDEDLVAAAQEAMDELEAGEDPLRLHFADTNDA